MTRNTLSLLLALAVLLVGAAGSSAGQAPPTTVSEARFLDPGLAHQAVETLSTIDANLSILTGMTTGFVFEGSKPAAGKDAPGCDIADLGPYSESESTTFVGGCRGGMAEMVQYGQLCRQAKAKHQNLCKKWCAIGCKDGTEEPCDGASNPTTERYDPAQHCEAGPLSSKMTCTVKGGCTCDP